MKKRTLALLLSSLMVMTSLTGCGGKGDSTGASAGETKTLKIAAFEGGYGKVY